MALPFRAGFSVARDMIPAVPGAFCQLITPLCAGVHQAAVRSLRKSKSLAQPLPISRPNDSLRVALPCAEQHPWGHGSISITKPLP